MPHSTDLRGIPGIVLFGASKASGATRAPSTQSELLLPCPRALRPHTAFLGDHTQYLGPVEMQGLGSENEVRATLCPFPAGWHWAGRR